MPDSIQVRDLLEMLERIEDKSAEIVIRAKLGKGFGSKKVISKIQMNTGDRKREHSILVESWP